MATTIRIKRGAGTTAPSSLADGELAVSNGGNGTDGNAGDRLFVGNSSNAAVVIGGKYFADMLDHSPGSLQNSSALITNSSGKLEELKVDDLSLNGTTFSSLDSNKDINITPHGTGKTVISNLYVGDTSTSLEEYIEDISGGSVTAGEGVNNGR